MIDVVLMLQAFFLYVLFLFAPGFIGALSFSLFTPVNLSVKKYCINTTPLFYLRYPNLNLFSL